MLLGESTMEVMVSSMDGGRAVYCTPFFDGDGEEEGVAGMKHGRWAAGFPENDGSSLPVDISLSLFLSLSISLYLLLS
jgi:hypothetical protein